MKYATLGMYHIPVSHSFNFNINGISYCVSFNVLVKFHAIARIVDMSVSAGLRYILMIKLGKVIWFSL
jgi:hypothetical protein